MECVSFAESEFAWRENSVWSYLGGFSAETGDSEVISRSDQSATRNSRTEARKHSNTSWR